jgi:hypothetical protein
VQNKEPLKKEVTKQEQASPAQKTETIEQPEKKEKPSPVESVPHNEPLHQATDSSVDKSKDSSYRPYQPDYTPSHNTYQTIYKPYQPDQQDTVPFIRKSGTIMSGVMTTTRDGKEYKISIDKNRATGLSVNGKKIAPEELPAYYDIISGIFSEAAADADREHNVRVKESEGIAADIIQHDKHAQAEDHRLKTEDQRLSTLAPIQASPRATVSPQTLQVKPQVALKRSPAEDIIEDLKKEGIVTITNPLSFSLNDKELIVNGKAQPTEVLKKFREKYVANPSNTYTYSKQGGTTSTSIVIDK